MCLHDEFVFLIDREISIAFPPDRSIKISFTFTQSPIARRRFDLPLQHRNRLVSVCSLSKFVSAKVRRFPRRTPEFPPPSYYRDNRNGPTRVNLIMCSCRTPRQNSGSLLFRSYGARGTLSLWKRKPRVNRGMEKRGEKRKIGKNIVNLYKDGIKT